MRLQVEKGQMPLFDGVVTYSSIEHSGLGRYGDALNPWGDILAVARAGCLTKPEGFFAINVPIGRDQVVWNAHRFYGSKRLPLLMSNWKAIDAAEFSGNKGIDAVDELNRIVEEIYAFRKIK